MADIRESHAGEITEYLRRYSVKYAAKLRWLGMEPEDFVQDVWVNLMRRQGLDQYDPTKCTSLEALVYHIAHLQVIDKLRARYAKTRCSEKGRPYEFVSIQAPISEESEMTFEDTLMAEVSAKSLINELMELAPDEQISPNYDLTWRQLFRYSFMNEPLEIAQWVGISESRIKALQKILIRMIRQAA